MVPSLILLLAHVRIYRKLAALHFWGSARQPAPQEETEIEMNPQTSKKGNGRRILRRKRGHKTTYLLVSVVVVFMCSWFPLNMLNVLLDLGLYKKLFRFELSFPPKNCHRTNAIISWWQFIIKLFLHCYPSTSGFPDGDDSLFRSWFSICHLVGMMSALANPILYGYYNQVSNVSVL